MQRVAAYARVSTDHEEQETSLTAQTDYYRKKILEHPGWEFVELYVDDGISGLSTNRREGFNRMVEDCLAGHIDLVLTKSILRFARNTVDTVTTIRKLKEKGVGVYFEKENIYTLDSKGYVTDFDSADDFVMNGVYVADLGNNTVTLNSSVEGKYDEFIDSKPLASGATVWNVEDTDDIFDTNLSKYDVVALVLNDDKAIKTAFILDTISEEDIDAEPVVPETKEGVEVTVDGTNKISVTWTGDTAPGNNDVINAIRNKLAEINGVDVSKVTASVSGSSYTFKAEGDFMTVTYQAFDISTDVQQAASAEPKVELSATAATFTAAEGGEVATVTVTGDGEIAYQWFSCDKDGKNESKITETEGGHNNYTGTTTDTLTAGAGMLSATGGDEDDGKYYVYCEVTYTEDGHAATTVKTDMVTITVTAD